MNRDEYVASLKSAAISIGKKAVMAALAKQLPKLFLGAAGKFFNPIVGFFVEKILVYAIQQGELGAFFLYIDMRVNKQAAAFEKSANDYHRAVLSGNKKLAAELEIKLKKDFAAFVLLTN